MSITGAYGAGGDVNTDSDFSAGIWVSAGTDATVNVDVVSTGENVGGVSGFGYGFNSDGIFIQAGGDIDVDATSVFTDGGESTGVWADSSGGGNISVNVTTIDTNYYES